MKIIDWFIEKTPKYMQLLYDAKISYAYTDFYKKSYENIEKAYSELKLSYEEMQKINNDYIKKITEIHIKNLRKILKLINKLDKNNEYVKQIKFMINDILDF